MKQVILLLSAIVFPMVSFAGGGGGGKNLASGLGICEKMKPNREKIKQVSGNKKVSNRCRQAIDQAEECYKGREATKDTSEKLQSFAGGDKPQGMAAARGHSAESLSIGREQYGRNQKRCDAIRENVAKHCHADSKDLTSEQEKNHRQYLAAHAEATRMGANGQDNSSQKQLAESSLETSKQLKEQIQANRDAQSAVTQGMSDESQCNHGYEEIYGAYAQGAGTELQTASLSGEVRPDQPITAGPMDSHAHPIDEKKDAKGDVIHNVEHKAYEVGHTVGVPLAEHAMKLGPAAQIAAKGTGVVFPAMSAANKDVVGTATAATQLTGDLLSMKNVAKAGLGASIFTTAYFYQDPNFNRCSEIYTDPVAAARAGGCPIQTTAGSMATQSAVRTLSGD